MKIKLTLAAISLAVLGLAGCSTTSISKTYPLDRVSPGVEIMPLNRNEYKVLGDTKGEACAKYLFWIKLPWFSGVPTKSVSGSSGGFLGRQAQIIQEATYDALEKIPGADALLSVRVRTHKKTSKLFYSEECVTVQGKAFAIKTDAGAAE